MFCCWMIIQFDSMQSNADALVVGTKVGFKTPFAFWILGMLQNLKFVWLLQDPVVRPISELGPNALQELLPEIPLWVKTPDYERVSIVMQSV